MGFPKISRSAVDSQWRDGMLAGHWSAHFWFFLMSVVHSIFRLDIIDLMAMRLWLVFFIWSLARWPKMINRLFFFCPPPSTKLGLCDMARHCIALVRIKLRLPFPDGDFFLFSPAFVSPFYENWRMALDAPEKKKKKKKSLQWLRDLDIHQLINARPQPAARTHTHCACMYLFISSECRLAPLLLDDGLFFFRLFLSLDAIFLPPTRGW